MQHDVEHQQYYGLVTYVNSQNAAAYRASKSYLHSRGVDYRLIQLAHVPDSDPILRLLKYVKKALTGEEQGLLLLVNIVFTRRLDFVIVKPASIAYLRPLLVWVVCRLCEIRGIKVYFNWGNCLSNLRKLEELSSRVSIRLGHKIINHPRVSHLVPTPQCHADAREWAGIQDATLINNAPYIASSEQIRAIPDEPPIIVNVASFQYRKGPDLFVEVALRVLCEHHAARFVWIGGLPDATTSEAIARNGAQDRILFIKEARPPFEWIRRSSGMLFTSRSEGFGQAVAEAMAMHRTVFCFDNTGASNVVGDTGVIVPQFDLDSLAKAIASHLGKSPAERINDGARRRYEDLFSPSAFSERLLAVLRQTNSKS